jgi:hypothetical protein
MFNENHVYGHSTVLRRYIGEDDERRFLARIQHGWQPGLGIETFRRDEVTPHLVWNARNLEHCKHVGVRRVMAIGAPFLYLPDLTESVVPPEAKSLVAFPFHGWEGDQVNADLSHYADSLSKLQEDGFGPITVCLYWLEYDNAAIREVFSRRGFDVTSLGHRDGNTKFLYKQRELLLRHAYVTSNRMSTATFYAMALGRKFFLHGPFVATVASKGLDPFQEWQEQHFGHLHYDRFGDRCYQALAEEELGLACKHSPAELKDVLGLGPGYAARRWSLATQHAIGGFWRGISGRKKRVRMEVEALMSARAEEDDATN